MSAAKNIPAETCVEGQEWRLAKAHTHSDQRREKTFQRETNDDCYESTHTCHTITVSRTIVLPPTRQILQIYTHSGITRFGYKPLQKLLLGNIEVHTIP